MKATIASSRQAGSQLSSNWCKPGMVNQECSKGNDVMKKEGEKKS